MSQGRFSFPGYLFKKLGNTATTTVFLSTKRLKYFFGNTRKILNLHFLLFQALSHGSIRKAIFRAMESVATVLQRRFELLNIVALNRHSK